MLDLHQTFRISSWLSINMIYDVKDNPILHVFSQEPSTSSKPPCNQKLTLSQSLAELSLFYSYSRSNLEIWPFYHLYMKLELFIALYWSLNLEKTRTPTGDKHFLSYIMSDLHQTFRISSQSSAGIFYDVKDDPILQVSSQKYDIYYIIWYIIHNIIYNIEYIIWYIIYDMIYNI